MTTLRRAAEVLTGAEPPPLHERPYEVAAGPSEPDLADVRGQAGPLLALQIAAAGGHNLLLEGAPGTGKTMLARRLPSILPPMTRAEAIEVTRIHSVAGVHADGLIAARPFRAPHHTISPPGWSVADLRRAPVRRRSLTAACCSSTSCPSSSARAWTRCASRSRTAASRSSAVSVAPLPDALHARRRDQPVPVRICRNRRPMRLRRAGSAALRPQPGGPLLDRMDLMINVRARPMTNSAARTVAVSAGRAIGSRRPASVNGTASPGRRRCNGEMDARLVAPRVRLVPGAEQALGQAYAAVR